MFFEMGKIILNHFLQPNGRAVADLQGGRGQIILRDVLDDMEQQPVMLIPEREQPLKIHRIVMRPVDAGVLVIALKREIPARLLPVPALLPVVPEMVLFTRSAVSTALVTSENPT